MFLELIPLYVLVTLFVALSKLKLKYVANKYLMIILLINGVTEISSAFLLYSGNSISLISTINIIITTCLWLLLMDMWIKSRIVIIITIIAFLLFSTINLFFIEGIWIFNKYTFIVGAFLYLIVFIVKSFNELKLEKFSVLLSNYYILVLSPIIYFFGFSFIFGFGDIPLAKVKVFEVKLYTIIAFFVNIIYYTLINIYIYRERKFKHA
ncbi:hypothetical protein [Flavobacterium sp. AG291]|uniref:hypothetical protein n=1 Tax=Flavobacterium sp. AG291 TaxID=2184000 RepID=UPI000E0C8382|nr:hypothetical protein [Flavobacterium sp. AG291]RDI13404.1 hypothetical protein DEU42_103318 [Flavobacterium sp. AG291]